MFDDGPLSHFTEAGWLGLLEHYVGACPAFIPDTVVYELNSGVDENTHLRQVLDAPWLKRAVVDSEALPAYGYYYRHLVDAPPKNVGECGVLAFAEQMSFVAVVDDGAARKHAALRGVQVKTTISILVDLLNQKQLSFAAAESVAENLLRTEYRLPFESGGFKQFLSEGGLYDPYGE